MENRKIEDTLKYIKERLEKVQLPWTATGNYPFYVDVRKPRESLSKHDYERPSYWQVDDASYMLYCVNEMPAILEYIKDLESRLKTKESEKEVKFGHCAIHNSSSQTCMIAQRQCDSWL